MTMVFFVSVCHLQLIQVGALSTNIDSFYSNVSVYFKRIYCRWWQSMLKTAKMFFIHAYHIFARSHKNFQNKCLAPHKRTKLSSMRFFKSPSFM
uniref:Secreted protein n=1 Tax=Panstrongylus lignarius TaxID=156445 RepID=A0A224XYG6_9HEMI